MKKKITFLIAAAVMLLTMMASTGTMWGQTRVEEVVYTLDGTITGGSNGYATESEITQNNVTWMVTGNTTMSPWRIGGKNLTNENRPVYSTSAFSDNITKVVVTNGTANLTVNSMTLVVSANADFSNPTSSVSGSWAASSTTTFARPDGADWSNKYFKLLYNVTAGTNNQYAQLVKVELYKEISSGAPSISAEDVELAYDDTDGEIAYTVNNPVTGGNLTAEVTAGDWLENLQVGETVTFNCDPNPNAPARTATVTLTYNYNAKETVSKNVTVTQAGNPDVVNNISAITAAGTYAIRGTIVAKSTRGFIVGDGTGYVYYYNQNYTQADYNIGDKVKLSGSVVVYGGVFEFNASTTVTAATESNYVAEDPIVLSGSDMDARVASTTPPQLSNYIQFEGKLNISDNHYNITDIEGATTAIGSISYPIDTDFTSLNGKRVKITGYYVGISTSTYYNTMLGSIEEIITDDPSIDADDIEITYDTDEYDIEYTINNPVSGGVLTASTTSDWLTLGDVEETSVPFTCLVNPAAAARTATVTLTYTYTAKETVTKNVTVTQDGNPDVINNISDITAAGNYVIRGTIVAKSQRGFVVGDGTGYVYYYNQNYTQADYNIGDKVKLSGAVVAYGGVLEFNASTTVTAATESNYVAEDPTVLSGSDMDARVGSSTAVLSSYVQYQGKLTVSGTYYNVTDINGATTAKGSISYPTNTDFTSLNGKTVTVTGYYVGVSSSTYYNTMIGSIEEFATPTITLGQYEYNLNADGGDAEIPVTTQNLAADPQLDVMFCDAAGAEYNYGWISGTVSNSTLYGHIDVNEGEPRTAYFKIKGLDANNNWVYSDLVTINQAASAGASIVFNTTSLDIMAGGENRTMSFDYEGLGNNPTFSVNFYSATGEPTTYSWITAEITQGDKVTITVEANEGEARTAYFKVYGVNGDVNAESNLVTINQEAGGTPTPTGGWILTDLADLTAGDIFVIVGTLGDATYAIQNDNGTNAPGVVAVTVANSALSGEPATNIQWNISGNATDGYTFYPNGDNENWLYCSTTAASSSNNNIKVGTGDRKVFELDNDGYLVTNDDYVDRYLSIYVNSGTAQDWRGYINTNSAPTIAFYKKVVDPSVPSIIANNVSIAYDATEGMIEYTIINPVEGASLEAVPTHGGDVFTMGEAANGTVPFTCSVNPNATERTATVELRYTYNRATIIKEVIITQAGNPAVISNISNITATGDYTVQGTVVAISNRGFILGDGTGYAYYYKGSEFTPGDYNIGDIKKMSGTVGTFNNVYQFPDGTTITDATDSNYNNTPEVQMLDATGIAAYSTNNHLSDYVQFEGTLVKSGNYYNIQVADLATDASISFPTSAQTAALDALENKTIVVKGYFAGVSSGHFGVILESAEEATTPNISVSPDEINVNAEEHDGTLTITVSNMTITDPNADLAIEFYDGNGTTITKPDWVDFDDFDESGENFSVYYIIAENDGDYRQAFLKVFGMGDTGLVYSNLVSINQEAPVTPPTGDEYDLYSGDLVEGDYLIVFDNCAMNTTVTNNRLQFAEVTVTNNAIINDNPNIVWHIAPSGEYWTIYNAEATAYAASTNAKNQATMIADGTSDNALWTVTGNETFEFENKARAAGSDPNNKWLRKNGTYGFACYASGTGGALSLYKKVVDPSAATIAVSPSTVNAPAAATNGTLTVTYHNINMNTVDIQWTSEEPNWVTLTFDNNNNVEYTISENIDTEARTVSFKVTGQNDNTNEDVYSNEITINQAGYVIDYVELPFGFDGGKADIENTVGLTQYDLDSDYNTSPKLKFKNTGSWVVLKFDGVLKSLSYDIKGNSFSGGTFDVELSSDGVNYTSIATYTELGATQTVTLIVDNENARYVRWIYTNKATGNVALGNIYASDTYDIYGEVTMDDLDASATGCIVVEGGVITVTGTITTNGPDDIMIYEGGQFIAPNSDFQATLQKQTTHASSWKDGSVDGWYFIASPVDQYETSPMIAFGNYDLFAYSEPDATWYVDHEVWGQPAAHPFTTLERGIGYLYANAADRDMYIAGDMKATSTQISKELSYTSTQSDDVRGFNLMGNPFTRNLGEGDMKFGETEVTVYYGISDEKDAIVSRNIGTDPIKPGQGFMIQVNEAGQDLIFNPSSSKGDNNGYISIVAGNESRYDNAFIQIANGNTLRKMNLSDDNTSVYVINDSKDFAAARVDELIGSMPVCFKAAADGEYTITIEAKNAEVEYMHLIDNLTGEDIDLLLESSYTFTANAGDNEARFRLDFGVNGINEVAENNMFAYQYGNDIVVSGEGQLQIFDVMGRTIMNTKVNGVQNFAMPQGVYIFRLNDNIQKIVVR